MVTIQSKSPPYQMETDYGVRSGKYGGSPDGDCETATFVQHAVVEVGLGEHRQLIKEELETAWAICSDLFTNAFKTPEECDIEALFQEITFCLLGGHGVSHELAASASERINQMTLLDPSWDNSALTAAIRYELEQPQFAPRRLNGELRQYRFPVRKSDLLVRAREWVLLHDDLVGLLRANEVDRSRREVLCQCPGMGPKTASWVLRNVGLSSDLAILDIHIVRALQRIGRISWCELPRDYEAVEHVFLGWCDELGARPAEFDLFLWEWQRGSLTKPCTT